MAEKIIIVDEEDNVIGSELGAIVDKKKLRYRCSALWIKNSKDEILLARRAYSKSHYPGRWGPAVTGTVDEGETYQQNVIKEAEEELGLQNIKCEKCKKTQTKGEFNHFTQWFTCTVNKPINELKIQEKEVVEIKWISKQELKEQLEANSKEFVPKMKEYIEMFEK